MLRPAHPNWDACFTPIFAPACVGVLQAVASARKGRPTLLQIECPRLFNHAGFVRHALHRLFGARRPL